MIRRIAIRRATCLVWGLQMIAGRCKQHQYGAWFYATPPGLTPACGKSSASVDRADAPLVSPTAQWSPDNRHACRSHGADDAGVGGVCGGRGSVRTEMTIDCVYGRWSDWSELATWWIADVPEPYQAGPRETTTGSTCPLAQPVSTPTQATSCQGRPAVGAAEMTDGLYRVTTSYLCAGSVVVGGRVTACAPILRRRLAYRRTKAVLVTSRKLMEVCKPIFIDFR